MHIQRKSTFSICQQLFFIENFSASDIYKYANAHFFLDMAKYENIIKRKRRNDLNCSINDIAAYLGLSRNTVSKAINGKPGVSEETRKKIIETAVSMKYRQFLLTEELPRKEKQTGSIILLTKSTAQPGFWLNVMEGIKEEIEETGLTLAMSIVSDEEINNCTIPPILFQSDVRGIVLVEVCNNDMCRKLLTLNIPMVSVDYPREMSGISDQMDVVTMENKENIKILVHKLYNSGRRKFAFAGNIVSNNTSQGVIERHEAFTTALEECGLRELKDCSLTDFPQDNFMNLTGIISRMKTFKVHPDTYICCNDWTAIQMMHALSTIGLSVPEDVAIAGFDDIGEAAETIPSLTTIRTPKELLGRETVHCLLTKIKDPSRASVHITAATELITRDSTGGIGL